LTAAYESAWGGTERTVSLGSCGSSRVRKAPCPSMPGGTVPRRCSGAVTRRCSRATACHLDHADCAEKQQHVARLDGGVVRGKRRDVRGEGNVEAVVDRHVAHPRQHADAAVLQLGLAHVFDVEGAREVERVEALRFTGGGRSSPAARRVHNRC
jgi:hypothetical protein